eukprot:gene11247-5527_t
MWRRLIRVARSAGAAAAVRSLARQHAQGQSSRKGYYYGFGFGVLSLSGADTDLGRGVLGVFFPQTLPWKPSTTSPFKWGELEAGLEERQRRAGELEDFMDLEGFRILIQQEQNKIIYGVEAVEGARQKYLDEYGCAKWTDEALAELAGLSPVVEMGAGGGQWAAQLKDRGCDILAYDNAKAIAPGGNGPTAAHVQEGNVAVLAEHGSRALFLCYPPPADESVGCMSAQCLQHYKGDTLVYVGEGKGGANASWVFFDLVEKEWECTKVVALDPFPQCYEHFYVFKRR